MAKAAAPADAASAPVSTDTLMRQRFHELRAEIEAIETQSAPIRAQRDAIVAQMAPLEAQAEAIAAQFKTIEAGLFEKKNALGALSRALDGNTALPDA